MAQLYNSLRPRNVHTDGQLQRLVELHRGRRMEHNRHAIGQNLLVGLADPQLVEGHVSVYRHQFVQSFWAFLPQPVKNLQNSKHAV